MSYPRRKGPSRQKLSKDLDRAILGYYRYYRNRRKLRGPGTADLFSATMTRLDANIQELELALVNYGRR